MLKHIFRAVAAIGAVAASAFAQTLPNVPPADVPYATPHFVESPFLEKPAAVDRSKPLVQYRMNCEIIEIDASGKEQVLSRPQLITVENFPAFAMIGAQSDEFDIPMRELLPKNALGDHLKTSFIPTEFGDGYIALDILLETSRITSVETKKGRDGILRPIAKANTRGARFLETVADGEKFSVAIDEPDTKGKRYRIDVIASRLDAAGKPVTAKPK